MPLIFVTGISTSGKSSVARELSKRGYEAYDTEHGGMSAWYDKATGERAAGFNEMPERTATWLDRHEWRISTDRITRLAKKAAKENKPIFICGGSANEPEVRALCSKTVWLKTNETTIRQRVLKPRDHDYGTRPHELARAIAGNKEKEAEYIQSGAIIVDATQPLHIVADEIIAQTLS
jgi:shikimate kinase